MTWQSTTRNDTYLEHARIVLARTRVIIPNLDQLLTMAAANVNVWLTSSKTEHPGEWTKWNARNCSASSTT
jgi:hypothetical protein